MINKTSNNSNKEALLWGLYDFANTPLTVAMGGMFLAQWLVLDNKVDEIWYGLIFTLSTILLLITSPFLGAWSDKVGKRMPFIKWTSVLMAILGLFIGAVTTSYIEQTPKIILTLIFFFLLQYFYQISLIFYNALLDNISTPETRGRISGIGQAFGEMGWLFGNIALLPFATGAITLLGHPGRAQVFLPATLIFVILGLPMIIRIKEKSQEKVSKNTDIKEIFQSTINGFKQLFTKEKNIAVFLVAFMLISDALLTASLYFAIFLDQVFGISDVQKVIIMVLLEIVSTTSALVISKISDKVGIKKILIFACIDLTLVYAIVSSISSVGWLYFLSTLIGFGYGGFYTTSRALLVKLSPKERLGEYFGLYSTFQKFASIIGPLIWGGIILLLKDQVLLKYRVGILTLSVLMLAGTLLMGRVKEHSSEVMIK